MPVNEFEKQVQKQLEEFQLDPSAAVWKNVEEEIKKKKRRRIIFFFILPVALGLIGYSIYQFANADRKTEVAQQSFSEKNKSSQTDNQKEISGENKNNIRKEETINDNLSSKSQKSNPGSYRDKSQKKETRLKPSIVPQKNNPRISNERAATGINVNKEQNIPAKTKRDISPVIKTGIPVKQDAVKLNKENKEKEMKAKSGTMDSIAGRKTAKTDSITDKKNNIVPKKDSISSDVVETTGNKKENDIKKNVRKSKIKWGIDLSAGMTASTGSLLSFGGQKSLDYLAVNNPGSATGAGSVARTSPSSIRSGPSFRAGVAGEIKVSQKSRLSAGLQYVYASTRIKTGARLDSTIRVNNNFSPVQVNGIYRGSQQNNFTNNFHFIQIPLEYHWQINKGKKLPIRWNAGISFAYLIATNGLVYDTAYGGIYYHNKEAFNKMHFTLGTGLSFRLQNKHGGEWIVGPEFSFDMRKLVNDPYDQKQYLLYGGISTRLLFAKKKK
jgi:hypothetical protein